MSDELVELAAVDLPDEGGAVPALAAAGRWLLHAAATTLVFFVAFLASGATMHAARGPHQHGCISTRGTCTDGP